MMMLSFKNFFPSHVGTFMSDRSTDFSLHPNQPPLSNDQLHVLEEQAGIQGTHPFNIHQVHENTVIVVEEETEPLQKADGLVTRLKNVPLVIRTADCLPVFIFDQQQQAIGLVHAGWRGTRERIVVKAIEHMQKYFQTQIVDLQIAFGPAIRSCCYEVGDEFAQYFPNEIIQEDGKNYLDLMAANKNQLEGLYMKSEQIHDCQICTCCNDKLFSYRREGDKAGRMISLMVLRD